MNTITSPEQCRQRLLQSAEVDGLLDHYVAMSLLSGLDEAGGTVYIDFLTRIRTIFKKNGERRVTDATTRIEKLQKQIGCTGVKNGICCMSEYIQLIPPEVDVEVVNGLDNTATEYTESPNARFREAPNSAREDTAEFVVG